MSMLGDDGMGNEDGISALCKDLSEQFVNRINEYLKRTKEAIMTYANAETDKAVKKSYKEFGIYESNEIRRIFRNAVDKWYGSYTPTLYDRQGNTDSGTGGLYEILDIKFDARGMVLIDSLTFDDIYNPSNLHPDRRGGSLYEKVFVQGWHGGAETISSEKAPIYGEHPNDGVPYYRTPHPYYSHWGGEAYRSESVYDMVQTELSIAEDTYIQSKFEEIVHKNNDKAVEEICSQIDSICSSIPF